AAAMSQVRSLLRGIAYSSGAGPAAVLTSLDATMQGLAVDTTATALVARLEQVVDERARDVTRLRWSSAGHLPPVLLAPDGTVSALAAHPPQLLLGVDPGTRRSDAAIAVDRGSTLLLYTDGLVERRGDSLEDGLARLQDAVAQLAHLGLEDLCDEVLTRLVPAGHDDDVALVAVRLHPLDRPRPVEAGPNRVPPHPPTPVTPTA
ncbi:PP2C family protein-serine/threonine phosphatase, partial [Kineococcus sp. G2]|uniref:PP2C family protein-serine/threonine phosphatase n=1 Tax=Kineococcus sp. G2 TaxID=3127484 RepID=UPI00301D1E6A